MLIQPALIPLTPNALEKLRSLHILLVEDNALNAKLLAVIFAGHGILLQHADNGKTAIEKIKENHFNLVLMDLEMPLMSGYQATAIIRNVLRNKIPIIAVTSHASPGEREKCSAAGMNAYLTKPTDISVLFTTIHTLTNGHKRMRVKKNVAIATTQPRLAGNVCNMGYLMNVTRGNKEVIHNIVAVFFKETGKELCSLNNAIENTNYTVIGDISHKIKSAFGILGISVLEPVFNEMEQLSSITSGIGQIEQLNREVNSVFKQARAEMKASYID